MYGHFKVSIGQRKLDSKQGNWYVAPIKEEHDSILMLL